MLKRQQRLTGQEVRLAYRITEYESRKRIKRLRTRESQATSIAMSPSSRPSCSRRRIEYQSYLGIDKSVSHHCSRSHGDDLDSSEWMCNFEMADKTFSGIRPVPPKSERKILSKAKQASSALPKFANLWEPTRAKPGTRPFLV